MNESGIATARPDVILRGGPEERGANENTNGLIRQYFSKSRDFATVASEEIKMVMNRLNNRPRKCLGYHTPNEVFFGTTKVALTS